MSSRMLPSLFPIVALCLGSACQLPNSIVVSPPPEWKPPATEYDNCRRAAEDYCRDVIRPVAEADRKSCVAEATYECVSGVRD